MGAVTMKDQLGRGDPVLGTILFEFGTLGMPHVVRGAGADFLIIDTEHSRWGQERVASLIAAGRAAGLPTLVRVAATERQLVTRPLDAGAAGVMIPMVETPEQARQVVSWTRYPPDGVRGAAFGIAHDDYDPGDISRTMADANRDLVTIALIETAAGVERVADIAAVDGVDVLWVGHFDLTASLGIAGQFDHPRYLACLGAVAEAAAEAGKAAGFMVASPEEAAEKLEAGFRCLCYWGDLWIYGTALRQGLTAVRESARKSTTER